MNFPSLSAFILSLVLSFIGNASFAEYSIPIAVPAGTSFPTFTVPDTDAEFSDDVIEDIFISTVSSFWSSVPEPFESQLFTANIAAAVIRSAAILLILFIFIHYFSR